ncbi:MAG: hypothetical protein HC886_15825 [Leptolyngbyaceae cyanobacterium SM1_1_3]|nr:hypothetical protein [Leptolyngbyaceae cyanobacterium SM1_1_3]NJO11843.1 hypothetical protein [Leptolyngbyaceae cyanobacterium SL_1_1]
MGSVGSAFFAVLWVFIQDSSTTTTDWRYWGFLLLAALFAPITLPSIPNQRIRRGLRRSPSDYTSETSSFFNTILATRWR